jgi:hypothetical protein
MKGHITITTDIAQEITAAWAAEHGGYYGRPHGYRSMPDGSLPPGYCDGTPHAGLNQGPEGTAWLRSSGTWAAVTADGLRLEFSGRRHSLGEIFSQFPDLTGRPYHITASLRPDLPPWETTDGAA